MSLWVLALDAFILFVRLIAMVQFDLLVDEFLVLWDFKTKQFEIEIKIADRVARWLVILKVQSLHIWVSQGLVNRYSSSWVKREHFLNQIDRVLVRAPEQFVEVLAARAWQLAHESAIVIILDLLNECRIRLADQVRNHHHLLLLGLGWQEGLSSDKLCKDAPNAPNINGGRVLAPRENDLWSAIPPRGDIVSKTRRRRH